MRLLSIVVVISTLPYFPAHAQRLERADLIGAWKLQRVEAVRSDGSTYAPYGRNLSGTLAYLDSGDMVVAWGRSDRPEFADRANPTQTEIFGAVEDFFNAYFGTFEIDATAKRIRHHVVGTLRPAQPRTLTRDAELAADTLVLVQDYACPPRDAGKCTLGEQLKLRLYWIRSR